MGLVTLVLVLAAVSIVVCLIIDGDVDGGPSLREHAARIGRASLVVSVRVARATVAGLMRAHDLVRDHRRTGDLRSRPPPVSVTVETSPSRFLALIELVILAVLTGAALAVALAGLAWAAARFMT